jgi:phospholipid/cholesterol/gamma-HCH transport system permease protein
MPTSFVARLGSRFLESTRMWLVIATIVQRTTGSLFRLAFLNHAVFRVIVRQLYFTAFQAIPVVCISALLIGSITVDHLLDLLTNLNAYDQIGKYLIQAIMHVLAPLVCTTVLLLRSGSAVLSEMALMKINREMDTLSMLGIPIEDYLYLPRIVAFAIGGPCLTIIFSLVALLGGYFTLGYFHDITFDNYVDQLLTAIDLQSIIPLTLKPFFMGLAVVLIAMEKGMTVRNSFTEVPIKLIRGMIHTAGCIIVIEIVFNQL